MKNVLLILLMVFPACTVIRTDKRLPVSLKEISFTDGKSRIPDVLATLGPPLHTSALPDGLAFLYESFLIQENQLSINLGDFIDVVGVQYVKLTFGRAKGYRDLLLLIFDDNGVLLSHSNQSRVENEGTGASMQFLFAVQSVTDTTVFKQPMPEHHWGMLSLKALPQTLNRNQDMNLGTAGLEQLGTDTHVGQHTLEMESKGRKKHHGSQNSN